MAKVIEINEEYKPDLYDSDAGESCVPERVVDITEDCPKASEKERAVLLFTKAKRGRIVQIRRPYENEVCMGSCIHFFVDELDREMRAAPHDDTFGLTAGQLGLTKLQLRTLIETHVPKGIDLDELQQEVEKLLALLKDRQKGMMSWHSFLHERLQKLHALTLHYFGK